MDDRSNLYDDIVTWAEERAPALRALAARSDPSNAVGWDDVIETSRRSEIHGIESLLLQTPGHVLEYASAPAAHSPPLVARRGPGVPECRPEELRWPTRGRPAGDVALRAGGTAGSGLREGRGP